MSSCRLGSVPSAECRGCDPGSFSSPSPRSLPSASAEGGLSTSPWFLPLTLPCFSSQFPGWSLCPRRCASWKTTPLHFPSWRFTSSAVPRRASSTTTPFPVTTTGWLQCRRGGPRPATRYRAGPGSCPRPPPMAAFLWFLADVGT